RSASLFGDSISVWRLHQLAAVKEQGVKGERATGRPRSTRLRLAAAVTKTGVKGVRPASQSRFIPRLRVSRHKPEEAQNAADPHRVHLSYPSPFQALEPPKPPAH